VVPWTGPDTSCSRSFAPWRKAEATQVPATDKAGARRLSFGFVVAVELEERRVLARSAKNIVVSRGSLLRGLLPGAEVRGGFH
jgi:hypothetical protein